MSQAVNSDTPFHRKLFVEMTQQEQDAWLEGIRTRRLASVEKHKQLVALKQQAKDERTRKLVEKECGMMEKELAALEKALEKVEARANKVAALTAMVAAENELEDAA
jgi:DNA-binding transcriptional regulator YbjK